MLFAFAKQSDLGAKVSIAAPPERGILRTQLAVTGSLKRVSIAAPPERGILRHRISDSRSSSVMFQLRPRRSGGFCSRSTGIPMIAWWPFQLRPRRSGGFCDRENRKARRDRLRVSIAAPPERGILRQIPWPPTPSPVGFNCGPAGAGDFAAWLPKSCNISS